MLELIKIDLKEKEAAYIRRFESLSGRTLGTADPMRLLLSTVAGIISAQETTINDVARQMFSQTARGNNLDYHGSDVLTERLPAACAVTTIEFTLSADLVFPIVIPVGTRIAAGEKYIFATDKQLTIPAGQISGRVTATCTLAGAHANGLVAGQIKELVDLVGYVQSAINISPSTGGADAESDENYRERIRIALESFSVAGPVGAYEYHAKSAHQSIVDVSVAQTSPGTVTIYPLLQGGELPSSEILELVETACSANDVRPLTDKVLVAVPERVSFDISLSYYIAVSNSAIQPAINDEVHAAVAEYISWQSAKLGRNINDSELVRRVLTAGASRVVLTTPVFQSIALHQQAVAENIAINYGGAEHD